MDGDAITVDDLFQNKLVNYFKESYGVLVPHNEISRRVKYNWLLKLNEHEIKQSDTLICYFLQKYT